MAVEVDGPRYKEIEVMAAEMETRLRESILRVLRPTMTQISDMGQRQKELIAQVERHAHNIDKVDVLQNDVVKQGELAKVVAETSASLADQVKDLETVYGRQYLDVQSLLESQQSTLTGINNDIVRLTREDSRIWDETSRLQKQHDEDVQANKEANSGCHKRIDREREELDGRIDIINNQRDQLLEDLYGEDKGLTLLTKELKQLTDFASPIPSMLRRITDTERGLKGLTQTQESFAKDFEKNRVEWHDYVKQQDVDMAEMKAHFKKQSNFLVSHNASIMKDIRRDYQVEILQVQEMREGISKTLQQVAETVQDMEAKLDKERYRIDRVQKEVGQEIQQVAKLQEENRASLESDVNQVSVKLKEEQDIMAPMRSQVDTLGRLIGPLLEACRVGCALSVQDFADRNHERWLCLPNERPSAAEPLKPTELEKQRQQKEDPRLRDATEVVTDLRKGLVRSCYQPGQVLFSGHNFDRRDMLILHSRLLQKAQQAYVQGDEKGQLPKADAALSNLVNKPASVPVSNDGQARNDKFRGSTVLRAPKEGVEVKSQKGHLGSQSARGPRSKSSTQPGMNATWQFGWPQEDSGPRSLKQEQLGADWVKLPSIQTARAGKGEPPKVATPPTSRPGTGADAGFHRC